jgi:hypothetical protein
VRRLAAALTSRQLAADWPQRAAANKAAPRRRTPDIPALQSHGMKVLGPFIDLESSDKFVFLRAFPSLEVRDAMS